MNAGLIVLDLHGLTTYQAKTVIDRQLRCATAATYRLRLIHGYRSGRALAEMIRRDYRKHPKVLRVELGLNQGETDLVLRDYW